MTALVVDSTGGMVGTGGGFGIFTTKYERSFLKMFATDLHKN
jgi:hypothetical protein